MKSARVIEIISVGFPYCAYKIVSGLALLKESPAGWLLVGLGVLDTFMNLINLAAFGRPVFGICTLHWMATRISPRFSDLGVATDVCLSCGLVASMIALRALRVLGPDALQVWNLAVVLNVLGAGFGRLSSSLRALKKRPDDSRLAQH